MNLLNEYLPTTFKTFGKPIPKRTRSTVKAFLRAENGKVSVNVLLINQRKDKIHAGC